MRMLITSEVVPRAIPAPPTSNRPGRVEAADDPHRVVRNPDPRSRAGCIRLIGYSPSAGFVLTVINDPLDHSGVTAWKTRGADLRDYLESKEAEE